MSFFDTLAEMLVLLFAIATGFLANRLGILGSETDKKISSALAVPSLLGGTPGQKGVWRYTLAFPNVAFIGYPVVAALFGSETLFYAAILVLPFNLMTFTLGPLLLTGAKRSASGRCSPPACWRPFWRWF